MLGLIFMCTKGYDPIFSKNTFGVLNAHWLLKFILVIENISKINVF